MDHRQLFTSVFFFYSTIYHDMPTPAKARRTARYRKRRATRRRTNARKYGIVRTRMPNRFNGAFPSSKIVKLKYNEYIPISSNTSGTVISQYRFNCNSLYDPNQSGTGHQPLYYDTYAGLYNHYLVLGSRIKVTWQGQSNSGIPIVVGVFLNDDTSFSGSLQTITEQNKTVWRMLPPDPSKKVITSCNFSAKRFFGLANAKDSKDNIGANVSTSPSEVATFTLFCQSMDLSTDFTTLRCYVEIEFIAQFSELQDAAGS